MLSAKLGSTIETFRGDADGMLNTLGVAADDFAAFDCHLVAIWHLRLVPRCSSSFLSMKALPFSGIPPTLLRRTLRRQRASRVYERALSYHRSTRRACKVFHRLGWPSPSSVSIGITPGYWVSSSHLPSPSRLEATSSIASTIRSSGVTPAARR